MRAGFWNRVAALLIDSIILAIVISILSAILGISDDPGNPISLLISLVLQFFYYGYFWSKTGQSIGKRLMGIKVVKSDGSILPFAIAGLRGSVGYLISSFILGLGYLWAAFDANKETWHDKIFSTTVIKA